MKNPMPLLGRLFTNQRRPLDLTNAPPSSAREMVRELQRALLIRPADWEALRPEIREEVEACDEMSELLQLLVAHRLLTSYQAHRIEEDTAFGLVLGNYRILDRIGGGGMGVVFKAEHLRLPRLAAVKVLLPSLCQHPQAQPRFYAEMQAVARLYHPNIVSVIDAGEVPSPDLHTPPQHYFVMDYVPGEDLERYVASEGPLSVVAACDLIHQVAAALAEAHKHKLVHRDIKPSNVLVTSEGQAKLLDFGLARHLRVNLTEPGVLIGTVDYMAPEQARDPTNVDARSDLYGLGGLLFWCLTGKHPFSLGDNLLQALNTRLTQEAPSVRACRPNVPEELDAILTRLMALDPAERLPDARTVMRTLLPFVRPESRSGVVARPILGKPSDKTTSLTSFLEPSTEKPQALVVDDERELRVFCRRALGAEGIDCELANDGIAALEALKARRFDLVLMDVDMPRLGGLETLQRIREEFPQANLKVLLFSGRACADELAKTLAAGADDYLTKPLSLVQFRSRVRAALQLKMAQDRSDHLNRELMAINQRLEGSLHVRDGELVVARNTLVLALAGLVGCKAPEPSGHLRRLQRYCRCLAEEATNHPSFNKQMKRDFIELLECCAPLHDIGMVGLPDHVLLKPGKLTDEERLIMQTHTSSGADMLAKVAGQHSFAGPFFRMAIDIIRHHHERYDGRGYPDRLEGDTIPLAARIVTIADVYDALRSRRPYKPGLSHPTTVEVILEGSPGQFDPLLLQTFRQCASNFEQIFRELPA
jgi:response regulator RpfG family c-di-GMP phosphodiesterase/serine/threonine protein kinase